MSERLMFNCRWCGRRMVAEGDIVGHAAPVCEEYEATVKRLGGKREPDQLRNDETGEIIRPIGKA